MRLHILSDLHLEFAPLEVPRVSADVVVVAGDVHKGHKGLECLRKAFPATPVVYVLGNHEYYGYALPSLTDELRASATGTNVHLLENQALELGGVTFLGATLWTDFALDGNPKNGGFIAEKCMNDFRLIRTSPGGRTLRAADMRGLYADSVEWLQQQLAARRGQRIVVVTHHLPSARSIAPRFSGDPLNPAFASNLDDLVATSGAVLWVHGHSHVAADYTLGQTRVLANPRGYPHETTSGFNPELVVEIEPRVEHHSTHEGSQVTVAPAQRAPRSADPKDVCAAAGFLHLLGREGGVVTAREAAILFGGPGKCSEDAVGEAASNGQIIAVRDASNVLHYPVWQFAAQGGTLPGLKETLAILAERPNFDGLAAMTFFLNPSARLDGRSPLGALREGGDRMIAAVKRLAIESVE